MYAIICEVIFFITWGCFLYRLFRNVNNKSTEKDQGISDTRDEKILNNISHLDVKLDETKRDFHISLDKLEIRFEKFEGRMDKVFDRVLDVLGKLTK